MANVGVFIDVRNLRHSVNKIYPGRKLAYKKYLDKALDVDRLYAAIAYGTEQNNEARKFKHMLRSVGFETKYLRNPNQIKSLSWNIGMTVDIIKLLPRLDRVVIGSSSYNFVPLIKYIQDLYIPCEIFACGFSGKLERVANKIILIDESLLYDEMEENNNVNMETI